MKKIVTLFLTLACLLGLCSCGHSLVRYSSEDYILELPYKEDFRILQLSDIHLAAKDNRKLHYDFLNLTISDSDADLIVLDGDIFTFASRSSAKELFAFIDSYGIPWTVTFGNHDEQCYFSIDWLTEQLNNYGSNCIFVDLQDDDVFGNSNFVINLVENDSVTEQIILMDSNRYNFGEYVGYDYIKQSQIDWYERLVNATAVQAGKVVPSILFFHIPLPEFQDAWEAVQSRNPDAVLEYGERREDSTPPQYNSGLFDKIISLGSTNGIFVAHDHLNDYRILYKGIYLAYGVHSTNRVYYDDGCLGGHVVIVHHDGSLDFEHIYHSYREVM